MKKLSLLILIATFVVSNNCSSQAYYKPDEKAVRLFDKHCKYYSATIDLFNGLEKGELGKLEKTFLKCIDLDSNFYYPLYALANIKYIKQDYFGPKGAIELYTKFLHKKISHPLGSPMYEYEVIDDYKDNIYQHEKRAKVYAEYLRFRCLLQAYLVNKDAFDLNRNNGQLVSIDQLANYFALCEEDFVKKNDILKFYSQDYFDFFNLKAEFEFNRGNYQASALSYKFILNKLGETNLKRIVYENIYNKCMVLEDYKGALFALIDFFKLPHNDNDLVSVDFQIKIREVIRLINLLETNYENNYQVCTVNGKEVFCDNKNIPLCNYSSAMQFYYKYKNYNIFDLRENGYKYKLFPKIDLNYDIENHPWNFDPPKMYEFYLKVGKDIGMEWPKYKPMPYDFNLS